MARPASIVAFEAMMLAGLAVPLAGIWVDRETLAAFGALGAALAGWFVTATLVLAIALSISRAGSRTARWVLTALAVVTTPFALLGMTYSSIGDWVALIAPIAATALVWQPGATAWIDGRQSTRRQPSAG
jgi:hypothetical protein